MKNPSVHKKKKGFSLIEMLLSVALVTILFSIAVPPYLSFYKKNDLDISQGTIGQTLRRAQLLSQAVDGDTTWGVRVESGNIVLFKGVSYAARDTAYDEAFDLVPTITPSGIQEVVFSKFSGEPQQTGTITLTLDSGEVRNITINEKGTVGY